MADNLSGFNHPDDTNLEQVTPTMQDPLRKFVDRIHMLAESNCLAVTVFGTIATPQFDPAHHTAKSVVVLHKIDLEMLRLLAQEGMKLGKAKIAAPLIMTPDYIQASVDTFPLEFLEIQQCHICIKGPDHFENLSFGTTHVRLQCERELKTILIAMRQGLLAAAGREKLLGTIESDVVERLTRTLRGILWLHGQQEFLPAAQTVGKVEQQVRHSLPGVRDAVNHVGRSGWEDFCRLYDDIEALKTFVDQW